MLVYIYKYVPGLTNGLIMNLHIYIASVYFHFEVLVFGVADSKNKIVTALNDKKISTTTYRYV